MSFFLSIIWKIIFTECTGKGAMNIEINFALKLLIKESLNDDGFWTVLEDRETLLDDNWIEDFLIVRCSWYVLLCKIFQLIIQRFSKYSAFGRVTKFNYQIVVAMLEGFRVDIQLDQKLGRIPNSVNYNKISRIIFWQIFSV